ncbi:MAG: anhydro-N-acetylmuramic acid kinase [Bacteroidia bacterium]
MKVYRAIGLMSGSSLDGLDVAFCTFNLYKNTWKYTIVSAETFAFPPRLLEKLKSAASLNAFSYMKLNDRFGKFSAKCVNDFIKENAITKNIVDVVASHGHTVFHRPELGFSTQVGCGATINALTGIPTVCDFRSVDVALGGQGAPLVPVGDELLFSEHSARLNIGGIANISYKKNDKIIAFDVCLANIALNYLTQRYFNCDFDKNGNLAKNGRIIDQLLRQLNNLPYYKKPAPKSLGREDFEKDILPLLHHLPIDSLRTLVEHISDVLANELNQHESCLVTGGGAYNSFLMERIKEKTICNIIIPDDYTIQFKEALIFAFLGTLRLRNEINTLSSVTGASRNSIGGALYQSK